MHENRMGTERLPKLIMLMSLPAMFSLLIQSLYNVVDSYYVSQLSEQAFRAVTIAMPMQQLLIAVGVGTAVGANSFIARSLGEKNQQMANRAAVHGFFLCGANWLLFLCIGLFFAPFFYAQFTVDPLVQTQGISYLRIVCSLSGGSILLIMIEKILQATGDMIRPMLMQLTGAVINIVLDPILIFGLGPFPAMGVSGAAIATVFSQWAACGLALSSFQRESRGRPHSAKVSTVQRNPAQDLSSRTAFHPDHLHHLFYGYDTEQPASQSIGTADIGAWCLLPFAVLCFHADLRMTQGSCRLWL